jgi:hypothetical protein
MVDTLDGLGHGDVAVGGLADLAGIGLKPHAIETWRSSTEPRFVDKVRDVVGLYMSPRTR